MREVSRNMDLLREWEKDGTTTCRGALSLLGKGLRERLESERVNPGDADSLSSGNEELIVIFRCVVIL